MALTFAGKHASKQQHHDERIKILFLVFSAVYSSLYRPHYPSPPSIYIFISSSSLAAWCLALCYSRVFLSSVHLWQNDTRTTRRYDK